MELIFVGMGIKGVSELTLRGLKTIKTAKKVLVLLGSEMDLKDLNIKDHKNRFESVASLYVDGGKDTDNYQRLFDKIVADVREHKEVVFLVTGHPRIGVSLVDMFEKEKDDLGINLTTVEGISSFDTILNDLRRDPLRLGSCIVDVNRFLLFDYQLETRLDTYIYHVASIGNQNTDISDHAKFNQSEVLNEKLLGFYDKDHPIHFVSSATQEYAEPKIISGELNELPELIKKIDFWTTMYIPGKKNKHINREFLKLVRGSI